LGYPALKVVHERLVTGARRKLIYTTRPVSQIAFELGFEDAANFARFFCGTGRLPAIPVPGQNDSIRSLRRLAKRGGPGFEHLLMRPSHERGQAAPEGTAKLRALWRLPGPSRLKSRKI